MTAGIVAICLFIALSALFAIALPDHVGDKPGEPGDDS